ncbi:MAG: GIY-YIG nuclease family protein, partial [candidate division WOR-3 bacterium]
MKLKTPRLVVQHLEGFSGKVLDEYPEVVSEFIRGKNGVYALYKRDRLYYVGLARNLRSRLRMHMRDRHAGKWDRFSIYLTEGDEHLKELEALILRIAEPPGNKVTGKFIDSHDLRQDLRRRLKAAALRKIDEFTCWEEQTDISEDDS